MRSSSISNQRFTLVSSVIGGKVVTAPTSTSACNGACKVEGDTSSRRASWERVARPSSRRERSTATFGSVPTLGGRIQAVRKARGLSARELALAIGGNPTLSTIENIELGRKVSMDVVQLLNIAMALKVPLIYLLAPLARVNEPLDLPGLSSELAAMTVAEFDSWLAGLSGGARQPTSLEERNATAELESLRLWLQLSNEVVRLTSAVEMEKEVNLDSPITNTTHARLDDARKAADRQSDLLRRSGWPV